MTLLPANFGTQKHASDTVFSNERDGDARADVTIPISASARKLEATATGGQGLAGVKDLGRLSVSDDGQLYWDGKPVVVRRRVQLSPWQKFSVILIGLAALAIALSGAVHVTITSHDWMCRAKWVTNYCPTPPALPARLELPN